MEAPGRPLKSSVLLFSNTTPLHPLLNNVGFFFLSVFFFETFRQEQLQTPQESTRLTKIHLIQKGANGNLRISIFQKAQRYPERQKGFLGRVPLCCLDNAIQPWPPAPTSQMTTARMFTRVIKFYFTPLCRRRKRSTLDLRSRPSGLLALTPVARNDIWKAFIQRSP